MVQLQTEVQDLQEAVAHLQQSNDERMGVLRDLVQQTADSVNKMSLSIGDMQKQVRTQQEASGSKLDQVSGQVQSLNDSVDEVKARLNTLEKSLQSVAEPAAVHQRRAAEYALLRTGSTPAPAAAASRSLTQQSSIAPTRTASPQLARRSPQHNPLRPPPLSIRHNP